MELKRFIHKVLTEHLNDQINSSKKFVSDVKGHKFQLFVGDELVAETNFNIEKPDWLFNEKYIGIFGLNTKEEHRRKGYMKYLMDQIFDYVRNKFNINYILLNVYKDNTAAVNLYQNMGFEIYRDYDEGEGSYFTLIKKLQ